MNRIALLALALLLPGCTLFLPTGANCSHSASMFPSCKPVQPTESRRAATLDDTYWKLVQLGEMTVRDGLLLREAFLRLDANRPQFSASGGCNQITGRYAVIGADGIRFSEIAGTRMACQGMELEQLFMKSLEQAARWRIEDGRLQLLDGGGTTLAILQATTSR